MARPVVPVRVRRRVVPVTVPAAVRAVVRVTAEPQYRVRSICRRYPTIISYRVRGAASGSCAERREAQALCDAECLDVSGCCSNRESGVDVLCRVERVIVVGVALFSDPDFSSILLAVCAEDILKLVRIESLASVVGVALAICPDISGL